MSSVTVELEFPQDWKRFQMPMALRARLNSFLDEQDKTRKLSKAEREEAQACVTCSLRKSARTSSVDP